MTSDEVPDGAALFPLIPEELEISPLLLAVLHAYVFLEGSAETIVDDAAALESMEYIAGYLQRLRGADLRRVREDLDVLIGYAKDQDWPREMVHFLQTFLSEVGVRVDSP